MRERLWLGGWLASLLVFTLVHDVRVLALGLVVWGSIAGRSAPRLLRRAVLAVALFGLTVSFSVAVVSWWRGAIDVEWLLRTNLRVVLLTATTLLVVDRVDLARALMPWPSLLTLLTVAGAQVRLLQRQFDDLKLGLRSRSVRRPSAATTARHAAASGAQFLGRAMHDAEEIGLAMQARGALGDRRP